MPDELRALATDGCEEPNLPVADTWPAIHHAATAFALAWTGDPSLSSALDANPIDDVAVDVAVNTGP